MIRKLLPIVLTLLGFLGGAAAGDMLSAPASEDAHAEAGSAGDDGHADAAGDDAAHGAKPDAAAGAHGGQDAKPAEPDTHAAPAKETGGHGASAGGHGGQGDPAAPAWFAFPQQFFIPVLHDGRLDSTMVLSLSAEMPGAASEKVYAHEIKLRDALLRQLLIHANTGGFDGNFTSEAHLRVLRSELVKTAQAVVPEIRDVLIGDIARQER